MMKKIASFTVNHLDLKPGIYLSRQDRTAHDDVISTFDIRLTAPNREPSVDGAALHTIEHIAATYLRNHPQWAERIIYWGPMGCQTGNYLIVSGDYTSQEILPLVMETFDYISRYEGDIPGATPRDCGNYSFMNLPLAREVAARYLAILDSADDSNLNYPA